MPADLDAERAQLLARDASFAAAAADGSDIEDILSFWTDDALVIPPGMPVLAGKPAIREYVRSSLEMPGFGITWTSDDVTFSADGTLAYLIGSNRVTMRGEDGTPIVLHGRVVTIWRRDEADGQWRCAVDVWNTAA